ncbi:uncharacterized protein LOC131233175 [Magnolia sinica]|uniref:uncharacterized protein LOC131233175 n=1 Tax=Magnolia sinica TaxID=86752 RepID=UPI002658191C|nr:uncharacterized protein LOC131233175 [Magnolia sinica]
MDSGNSGSMQSSSGGGDEEYDSRTESFSAFLNSSGQISGPMMTPAPPSSSHHHHHNHHHPSLFDPLSNYLDTFPRSPPPPPNVNSLPNLDMAWTRGPRSEPNCTNISGLVGSSSSSTPHITGPHGSNRIPYNPINPLMPLPSGGSDTNGCASATIDQPNPSRNPKKRSRASRRAPTTVLTTDTSNFRAMVQEFTGIPAPPFSASTFPRTRLDLFNTPSAMRMSLTDPPPPYLLRPFVQKVPPPYLSSSSTSLSSSSSTMVDVGASTTATNTATNSISTFANSTTSSSNTSTTSNAIPTNNYQLLSDLGLTKQNQSMLNMNNPIFTFQSSPLKYPLSNLPAFGSKSVPQLSIPSSADSQLRVGMLDGFSMNHGHVSAHHGPLSSLIAPDGRNDNPPRWGTDGAGPSDGDQVHSRPFGNYGGSQQQRVSSCKLNYNASSSDFHAEKGPENVPSRGEGMVDSWICSSD